MSVNRREAMARAERLHRRAGIYADAGDRAAAAATYREILALLPDDVAALLGLGLLALHRDAYRDAHALALRAAAVRPTPPDALAELCESLRTVVEMDRLIEVAAAAEKQRAQASVETQRLVSVALTAAGEIAAATRWIDAALARAPDNPACRTNRVMLRTAAGDFAGAAQDIDRVLARHEVPFAHWLRARLPDAGDVDARVARLRDLLAMPHAHDDDRAYLGFALHLELDRAGRHDEAFAALDAACAAHRRNAQPYDEAASDALFDALHAADFTAPPLSQERPSADGPVPIFIVGMFRSGTTLLERLLGAHSEVADLGESRRFTAQVCLAADHAIAGALDATAVQRAPGFDYATMGRGFIDACRAGAGLHTHFTEKLPSNFLLLGLIRRALPHARVLHLVRDPVATCWSNLRERFLLGAPYSYRQDELARYYIRYHRLMAHWRRTLPGFVHDVRYEDLVAAPEATMRAVLDHCGLAWEPACASTGGSDRPVTTASAIQVRAPVHARSVARWRPYAEHLRPLRTLLHQAGVLAPDDDDTRG